MKLRRALLGAAGAVGAVAVANRALAGRAGDLTNPLPGTVGRFRWRGLNVAYAEAGDPEDPDLLLVHGLHAAASNKEFDRVADRLAEEYHVVAPDFPGFGLSDRPPLVYSGSLYTAFLADFAREVTDDAVCVATSLSAGYAVEVQRETSQFSRLVLVCPTADTGGPRVWLRTLARSPIVGTALFNALTSKPLLRYFGEREVVLDPAALTDEDVEYYWQTAHQPGAKYAPASFVGGFLDPDVDLYEALPELEVPVTLVWGEEAPYPPASAGRELAETADARMLVVDASRLLPHHEHPEVFLEGVETDLPKLQS